MSTRTIVCFGDSNTHGARPLDGTRFLRDVRWPGVLRRELGDGYEVIEEGLNARTTVYRSPLNEGRVAADQIQPCLWSHAPVDLVAIMLGTNDLKAIFRLTAAEVASGAAAIVDLARRSLAGPENGQPEVLLIAPPTLGEATRRSEYWGFGAAREQSRRLGELYLVAAQQRGVPFLDAGSLVEASPIDGVHLDEAAHAVLGRAVAAEVRRILG